jgi:hypothetical protein
MPEERTGYVPGRFDRPELSLDVSTLEDDLIEAARHGRWPQLVWDDAAFIREAEKSGMSKEEREADRAEYLQAREALIQRLRHLLGQQ